MELYAQTIADIRDFAQAAKNSGAHGITLIDTRLTTTGFLSIGDMSYGGDDQTTFEVRLCTSIGTVYCSESHQSEDDIRLATQALEDIGALFPLVRVEELTYNTRTNRTEFTFTRL